MFFVCVAFFFVLFLFRNADRSLWPIAAVRDDLPPRPHFPTSTATTEERIRWPVYRAMAEQMDVDTENESSSNGNTHNELYPIAVLIDELKSDNDDARLPIISRFL